MTPPKAPSAYDAGQIQTAFNQLARADAENIKRERDAEIGRGRLILRSANGSRWSVTVSNAGALTITGL